MKAIQLEQPGQFRTDCPSMSRRPRPGEALVRVHRVGICGTDISGYLGKMPFFSYPRIPGHELGVEVVAVGPGVDERQARRPLLRRAVHELPAVLLLPARPAELLREPASARRPHRRRTAAAVHRAGPQAASVDEADFRSARPGRDAGHRLPCRRPRRTASGGQVCLVIGAGPIGLSVIEFVKLTGATITVLDMNEKRLDFCKNTMGVPHDQAD